MTDDEKGKTLFNAGVAKLMRIDKIKTLLIMFGNLNDDKGKLHLLESFRTEMDERLADAEKEKCNSYEKKAISFFSLDNKNIKWDNDIMRNLLIEYERYLNQLEYKYGYSMPDQDDDEGL